MGVCVIYFLKFRALISQFLSVLRCAKKKMLSRDKKKSAHRKQFYEFIRGISSWGRFTVTSIFVALNNIRYLSHFTVFGRGLCLQFDIVTHSAPVLVERCTHALEQRAFADTKLDLYKVYHNSNTPNEQTLELRQKLNEGKKRAGETAAGRIAL